MIDILEQNSRIRRMFRQMVKAMHYLSELSMIAEIREPESEPVAEVKVETEAAPVDEQQDEVTKAQ